jgi:hypothetical protein
VVQPSKINLAELASAAASILPSNSWNSSRVRSGDGLDILLPPAEARTANRQLRDDLLARVETWNPYVVVVMKSTLMTTIFR